MFKLSQLEGEAFELYIFASPASPASPAPIPRASTFSIHGMIEADRLSANIAQKTAMAKYVMWGTYCEDVLEKRKPYRQAHLAGIAAQKEAGLVMTLGPTKDGTMVFGIYDAEDEAAVRKVVESDPYWENGIWTEYDVKEWIQAF